MALAAVESKSAAQVAFLSWVKKNHPTFYAQLQQNAGLGDVTTTFNSVLNTASGLLTQYVAGKQQLALLKMNIERAKAGQLPLTSANYASITAGPPAQPSVPTWVWFAGGAAVLLLLLKR
jgi:hypothetical protein